MNATPHRRRTAARVTALAVAALLAAGGTATTATAYEGGGGSSGGGGASGGWAQVAGTAFTDPADRLVPEPGAPRPPEPDPEKCNREDWQQPCANGWQ
ncbi:hypothetical protein [Streptomyces xiamenensis]|uniref:hypothetical protein n=1 Tax=Streptomyces xiamenensis TaxID=408015 RepID=UPI0035E0AADC